jgi:hypothetical protein
MKLPLAIIAIVSVTSLQAQPQKMSSWKIGITTSQTARPLTKFSALFYTSFHPGFEAGYLKFQKAGKKSSWQIEPTLAYTYHRWVQHTVSLVLNEYYRYYLPAGFNASARIGAGYQLSIPTSRVYQLSDEMIKAKKFAGRSQFTFNAALGVDKQINNNGWTIGLLYQQKIQTPFVKNYVPLLPYNSMMIAMTIPIHPSKAQL